MTSEIDPTVVLRALDVPFRDTPQPVSGGWDTSIWKFQGEDGAQHALRLLRPGLMAVAERERVATETAAAGGVPVARVEHFAVWQDRPAFVLQWVDGKPLFAHLERRPWTLSHWAGAFAQMQARLHRITAPAALAPDAPGYWLHGLDQADPALADRLRAVTRTDTLVHLDYHPLNVLATDRGISAVIDWTNGAAGDPRADIARTAALLTLAPLPRTRMRPVLDLVRRLFIRAWWRSYRRHAPPVRGLAPFMAWAGLKFLRDTEPRIGNPGVWATPEDLDPMRAWVVRWRTRAGLA